MHVCLLRSLTISDSKGVEHPNLDLHVLRILRTRDLFCAVYPPYLSFIVFMNLRLTLFDFCTASTPYLSTQVAALFCFTDSAAPAHFAQQYDVGPMSHPCHDRFVEPQVRHTLDDPKIS